MPRRIVLATDGSASALSAARYLRESGIAGHGTELAIIHVSPQPRAYAAHRAAAPVAVAAEPTVAVTPEARAAVDATLGVLGAAGAGALVRFVSGLPAEEIVAYARQAHADLIVVGKRGRNPSDDLLLGSVCEQVLHAAPCAVLVVGLI